MKFISTKLVFKVISTKLFFKVIPTKFLLQELVITHIELVINSLLYEYMGIQFHDQQVHF